MSRENRIRTVLTESFTPTLLDITNESHQHSGPGSETHFKIVLVSSTFEDLNRISRHRKINDLLQDEMSQGLHALTLHLFTPVEWQQKSSQNFQSPPCMGGSKKG